MSPDLLAALVGAAREAFDGRVILAAYVYGSRVSGRPRPESDLDVGYYLDHHRTRAVLPAGEEMRLANRLAEAVGFEVDLRNLAEAPLDLRGRILEEGVRIYSGDAAARVALERDLLARYHDYKAEFEQMHAMRLRARAARSR